ncbi:hypothetical protein EC988_005689, partial [Linderina pennispora]
GGNAADGWVARAARSWIEGKGRKLLAWEAGSETGRLDRRAAPARATIYRPRQRWSAWQSGEFATLNSSFPFTIPAVPSGVFLFAQTPHPHVPSAVLVPPGMGTAARKFHSSSLGRQPGSPFGDRTEHVLAPTDSASISAQLHSDGRSSTGREKSRRHESRRVQRSFVFAHAASGIPKHAGRVPLERPLEGESLAASCGEDAFFHRNDALGIADGVGGWAGVGDADPALFARRLMHHASAEVARFEDIDDEQFAHYHAAAPVDILRRAYEITLDEMEALGVRGSSTACVVVLRGDELRVANLGDCSLTVVRQGDMVYRTEEQQHSFNFPYQLGTEEHSDGPSDAQVFRLKVQRGDIVIVGSDGVFDNLFDDDILDEVNQHLPAAMRAAGAPELKYSTDSLWYEAQQSGVKLDAMCESGSDDQVVSPAPAASRVVPAPPPKLQKMLPQFHVDPRAISRAIAERAKLVSEDTRYAESPFQMRAMQEGLYYQGGKRDDISVIVAIVTDLEDSPDRR